MHAIEQGPVSYVDLLRHGLPEGGTRYRGHRDDPLAAEGWAQMWAAVGEHSPWRRVISSPLSRCAAFARALAERHELPLAVEPRFKEISFGDWEGRHPAEVFETQAEAVRRYWQDPVAHTPPGGEPLTDFAARVTAGWDALVAEMGGEHVLVVAHGGVIRVILAHVLGMPLAGVLRLEVAHAALSRIRLQLDVNGAPAPSLVFHGGRL